MQRDVGEEIRLIDERLFGQRSHLLIADDPGPSVGILKTMLLHVLPHPGHDLVPRHLFLPAADRRQFGRQDFGFVHRHPAIEDRPFARFLLAAVFLALVRLPFLRFFPSRLFPVPVSRLALLGQHRGRPLHLSVKRFGFGFVAILAAVVVSSQFPHHAHPPQQPRRRLDLLVDDPDALPGFEFGQNVKQDAQSGTTSRAGLPPGSDGPHRLLDHGGVIGMPVDRLPGQLDGRKLRRVGNAAVRIGFRFLDGIGGDFERSTIGRGRSFGSSAGQGQKAVLTSAPFGALADGPTVEEPPEAPVLVIDQPDDPFPDVGVGVRASPGFGPEFGGRHPIVVAVDLDANAGAAGPVTGQIEDPRHVPGPDSQPGRVFVRRAVGHFQRRVSFIQSKY